MVPIWHWILNISFQISETKEPNLKEVQFYKKTVN
jgi:hypothetical protein